MSGLVTNEEERVINEAYVEPSHLEQMVKSTSSFALEYTMSQRDVALDWNVMAAYVAPEDLPPEVTDSQKYKEGLEICATSYPFIYSLDKYMNKSETSRAYLGMKESAILCTVKDLQPYMIDPVNDPNYQCPATQIPYTMIDWDEKFMSPACTDWF